MESWPLAIQRLIDTYGDKAEVMVPGHGAPGGMDLPRHTLEMLRKQQFLFYLHGRIVEDQGIHAISDEYGPYQYEAIVETLEEHGFKVLSEARPKDTDPMEYAQKVAAQIKQLRLGGVPAGNITVVGASKGAGITALISDLLEDEDEINYVLLAICSPMMLDLWQTRDICVRGNVLSIFDEKDKLAGSCREFFRLCEGSGLRGHREVELKVGTGHGIVYQPLEEWIGPLLEWVK